VKMQVCVKNGGELPTAAFNTVWCGYRTSTDRTESVDNIMRLGYNSWENREKANWSQGNKSGTRLMSFHFFIVSA